MPTCAPWDEDKRRCLFRRRLRTLSARLESFAEEIDRCVIRKSPRFHNRLRLLHEAVRNLEALR